MKTTRTASAAGIRRSDIAAEYLAGTSITKIARRHGMCFTYVREIIVEHDIEIPKMGKKRLPADKKHAAKIAEAVPAALAEIGEIVTGLQPRDSMPQIDALSGPVAAAKHRLACRRRLSPAAVRTLEHDVIIDLVRRLAGRLAARGAVPGRQTPSEAIICAIADKASSWPEPAADADAEDGGMAYIQRRVVWLAGGRDAYPAALKLAKKAAVMIGAAEDSQIDFQKIIAAAAVLATLQHEGMDV